MPAHVKHVGERVIALWNQLAQNHGIAIATEGGRPCLAHFHFEHELSEQLRTLYTQLMLERGFLAGAGLYATLAHTDEVIDLYGEAIDAVFAEIADALRKDDVKKRLKGPVAHSGFSRLVG